MTFAKRNETAARLLGALVQGKKVCGQDCPNVILPVQSPARGRFTW